MTADSRRAIELEDLFRIAMISDPRFSPSGEHLAWVETRISKDENTYKAALWIAEGDGGTPRKLTSGAWRDTSPQWAPDGRRIAFLSNRTLERPVVHPEDGGDKDDTKAKSDPKPPTQVWCIAIDGGEARQVTAHPGGVAGFAWSPDGASIAFAASDKVGKDASFTAPSTTGPYADERTVNDIRYRFDGRGWLETFSHVWSVDVDSGEMQQRTFGDANDSDPVWTIDGAEIIFTRAPRETRPRNRSSSIHAVNADGTIRALLPENGSFDSPSLSPDGTKLAFLDGRDPGVNGQNVRIGVVRVSGGSHRSLDGGLDLSFGDYGMSDVATGSDVRPIWLDDSTVAMLASTRGSTHVYRLDVEKNAAKQVTEGERRIMAFAASSDRLAYVGGEIHRPTELFVADRTGKQEQQVTSANTAFLEEVRLAEAIELDVTAPDGQGIQAWLLPPFGLDPERPAKYPLIVQIHGGPHSMYANAMFHEMQLMAAKGYGVVFCNPRGSAGYGEQFTMCTRGTWGEADMPDVMATLEKALEQPWVDRERLGVTGGSYGGYLTNWIIGHTDRFKAAVTQRCVSNFYSFFGTSDIGFDFGVYESGGTPWADAEKLLRHSPVSYVDKITTPLLILHSERDLRCPIEQAEQMFAALRYLDREVHFVRIPEEGHELSRSGTPSRRLARLQHLIGWFDTHL